MDARFVAIALISAAQFGCIFGGGDPPVVDNNGDGADGGNLTTDADRDSGPEVAYLAVSPNDVSCPFGPQLSFITAADLGAPIDGEVAVGVGEAPQFPEYEGKFAYTVAWVSDRNDSSFGIRVATIESDGAGSAVVRYEGGLGLPAMQDSKVYAVLAGGKNPRPVGGRIPVYEVTLLTSEGVFVCDFDAPEGDPMAINGGCKPSDGYNGAAQNAAVFPPTETRLLPVFRNAKFIDNALWMLGNSFWVARGGIDEDKLGAFFIDGVSVRTVQLEGVATSLLQHDPEPTLVPGVDEGSRGFPYLTLLGKNADGDLFPAVLSESGGNVYKPRDDLDWHLPPGFEPGQPFVFASGAKAYVDSTRPVPLWAATEYTLGPQRAEVRFGYATTGENSDLVLSRAGGFTADADFARVELADPVEALYSAQNLEVGTPGQSGTRDFGRPMVMVVSGDKREKLSFLHWDVGLDLDIATDLTAGTDVTEISDVSPPILLVNGQGLISFQAQRAGTPGVGVLPVDLNAGITRCK